MGAASIVFLNLLQRDALAAVYPLPARVCSPLNRISLPFVAWFDDMCGCSQPGAGRGAVCAATWSYEPVPAQDGGMLDELQQLDDECMVAL